MLFSVSKHYDLNSLGKLTHEFQTKAFTGIQHQSTGIRHYSDPTDRTLFYSTLFFTTSPFNDFSVQNVSTANRETTANRENGYDVCQTVLERLKCHVTSFESFKKLVGSCISSLLSKIKIMICFYAVQLEKVIEGILGGPIHTHAKNRRTHEHTIESDER